MKNTARSDAHLKKLTIAFFKHICIHSFVCCARCHMFEYMYAFFILFAQKHFATTKVYINCPNGVLFAVISRRTKIMLLAMCDSRGACAIVCAFPHRPSKHRENQLKFPEQTRAPRNLDHLHILSPAGGSKSMHHTSHAHV